VNPTDRLIQGPYVSDLLDQPAAVRGTAQALGVTDLLDLPARVREGAFDRVVLTGMGTSLHALQVIMPRLLNFGLPVVAVETGELIHSQFGQLSEHTLLLVISQSGRSVETLRLLDKLPPGCHLVGITNDPRSPLAERAQMPIITHAGTETTVSCKTYLATVVALLWLIDGLEGGKPPVVAKKLASAADAVAAYLSSWRRHTEALAARLEPARHLFVLARGPSLAAATTGALIIKEAGRFPAEAMSSSAFRHGPLEMVSPETGVFVLKGVGSTIDLNRRLYEDLQSLGMAVHLIDRETASPAFRLPSVDDGLLPLVEVLPLQMTSLALAALSGHEAGRFSRATKVTTVE
jgi:glucosamine--fructose-6-phosphate aminotransferase (isomerizing)